MTPSTITITLAHEGSASIKSIDEGSPVHERRLERCVWDDIATMMRDRYVECNRLKR